MQRFTILFSLLLVAACGRQLPPSASENVASIRVATLANGGHGFEEATGACGNYVDDRKFACIEASTPALCAQGRNIKGDVLPTVKKHYN
jgi:hypothetical protein